MKPLRSLLIVLPALPAAASGAVLFADTFDRADNRNIGASLSGITNNTGSSLAPDGIYSHGHIDPNNGPPTYGVQDGVPTNGGGARIIANTLQLAVDAGTSNAFVNHNFTNAAIVAGGGFSVSFDVTAIGGSALGNGAALGVGMSFAQADSTGDAFDLSTPKMSGAFHDTSTIGGTVPANVVSDFWVALRGNNTLVWGGGSGTISGLNVGAKTGTVSVDFTLSSFAAGETVGYEVFFDSVSRGTGTFTWSGGNENFIGLDARDPGGVNFDNFTVAAIPEPSAAVLGLLGLGGLLLRRRR